MDNIIDITQLRLTFTQPYSLLGVDSNYQLVRANNEVPQLQSKINEIQNELNEVKESIPTVDIENLNDLENRVGRLEVKVDYEQMVSTALDTRLVTAENKIENLTVQSNKAYADRESLNERITTAEDNIFRLWTEVNNIKENPSTPEWDKLNEMQQEINALTSQIGYMRNELDDINEKLERNNIV